MQCQDLFTRLLRRHYNQGAGIRARHPGENTRVNNKDVVSAVNLGV